MTDRKPTTCMRCAVGCGYRQRTPDDGPGFVDVRGDDDHPTNRGRTCSRGVSETVDPGGERLTEPLIRRGGTLRPTDWDTALGTIAMRIIEALRESNDNVAVLGSGQQTNEAAYALGKLARGGFGTRHYDANTTLCMASAVRAYVQAFGSDAPPPTYEDVPKAQTHVIWGANPKIAHPVLYRWIAESAAEDDGELIVVDPVESETAADADLHVRPEPGTDLALARAVLASVVDSDSVDRRFVERHTEGFEAMVGSLPAIEVAAETAGVSVERVAELAAAFDARTIVYWGMGVNQSVQGTGTARSLIDCCLATGNLGPGSGPFSLTGQANSMGNRVCASKSSWPGYRSFEDPAHRKAIANAWGVPLSRLPDDSGPGFVRIIDAIARDNVDVCWTVATNPVAGMPDAGHVTAALDDTFLVAQDAFRSDTVELADVVLPAATWGESEGTVMNMERRVSRVSAVRDPPEGVRQDVDVIAAVADRVVPELFESTRPDPESLFDEVAALTRGTTADVSGISYDRLSEELAVRWPAPEETDQGGYRYYDGDEENATGGGIDSGDAWSFRTDSGRARFSNASHEGVPEPIDEQYPLTLTTGRRPDAYNTGVRTRTDAGDEGATTARIHPETIADYLRAFDRGETVIESRRAAVAVAVEPDGNVPPGLVWLPVHNPAANELTLSAADPDSAEPNLKQCAVGLSAPDRTDADLATGSQRAGGTGSYP
ncbi:assimilatory nitrate reductase catalytic subunit [Halorubrum alkaliphilum]|uniref:Assimilatory nitrate reductase catalytic subunit n=1 Tax=Halorubrum alkaliphilum TaxID=261290 RepID=A0A8T4GE69_9EURY|nr:assimilatory nitrate reductase NasA [Halorubrum alkaliphilum]MBP1922758.1 assimilatory nitrate reductase catalytic subunit [Halorubrum alkaliphilum]